MATAEDKYAILISQRGCCIYCGNPLDGFVYKRGNSIDLELEWDHAIPRALRVINDESNIVASCQICNSIKNDLVFDTIEEARGWIQERRRKDGYTDQRIPWYDEATNTKIDQEEEWVEMKCPKCGLWFSIRWAFDKHILTEPSSCIARAEQNKRRVKRGDWKICPGCLGRFRDIEAHIERKVAGCLEKARKRGLNDSDIARIVEEESIRKAVEIIRSKLRDRISAGEIPMGPRGRKARFTEP